MSQNNICHYWGKIIFPKAYFVIGAENGWISKWIFVIRLVIWPMSGWLDFWQNFYPEKNVKFKTFCCCSFFPKICDVKISVIGRLSIPFIEPWTRPKRIQLKWEAILIVSVFIFSSALDPGATKFRMDQKPPTWQNGTALHTNNLGLDINIFLYI